MYSKDSMNFFFLFIIYRLLPIFRVSLYYYITVNK